jgi:hypothetical protein
MRDDRPAFEVVIQRRAPEFLIANSALQQQICDEILCRAGLETGSGYTRENILSSPSQDPHTMPHCLLLRAKR